MATSTRRSFLKLLGIFTAAPRVLYHALTYPPRWTELLSPGLYSAASWKSYEELDTHSTRYLHQSYSLGFRVAKEMLDDLPSKHWLKKVKRG